MIRALHQTCIPRSAVLDGTADFVVNLADLPLLTEAEAAEFLDSNVLTSGMALLLGQAFARLAGTGSSSGIYKLSESMGWISKRNCVLQTTSRVVRPCAP